MGKRYQGFVSSTYADLPEERQEVMQALLELDCIPAGMELFPAANEDQWTLIKNVIDDCDYYLVILAGRYGSIGPDGLSYTEMEYRYALETGKPVIGFVHREPGKLKAERCETPDASKEKLVALRGLVQQKMCRFWDSPADLGSQVSRSLVKLIKSHLGAGWVRGDLVPAENATEEILALQRKVEELEAELASIQSTGPAGTAIRSMRAVSKQRTRHGNQAEKVPSRSRFEHEGRGRKDNHIRTRLPPPLLSPQEAGPFS